MSTTFKPNSRVLIQTNPSLVDLIAFTRTHEEYFRDLDLTVLQVYYNNTVDQWSGGKYYLHGQLPLLPDTPITQQIIDDAKNIHIQRGMDYGSPCNSFESASINTSINRYNQIIMIIDLYQTVSVHLLHSTDTEYLKKGSSFFEQPAK